MKKYIVILLLYSCSSEFSEINFSSINFLEKKIGVINIIGGTNEDVVKKVISTNDGGFVLVGNSKSTDGDFDKKNRTGNDIFLIKMDPIGKLIWTQTYGGSDDDIGNDVVEASDGSFYIIGYSKSNDGDATVNMGQHDNWLIKTDSYGKLIWEKSYGFKGHDHAYSIIKTNDGGLFFNGFFDFTASGGQGDSARHGVGEFWCHKVNINGDIVWRKYFGGTNNDRSYDAVETEDGGFIIVGTSESQDVQISNPFGSYDMWIVRLSSAGDLLWEKSFGGSSIDEAVAIIKNQDNNFTILGNTNSKNIEGIVSKGINDFILLKINSSGNIISKICHGSSKFDYAKDIIQTEDGSQFVIGYSRSSNDLNNFSLKNNAVFLSQTQPNGIIQKTWQIAGDGEDLGYSVSQIKNGSIVLVGTTESNDGDFMSKVSNDKDIFIAILNE